MTKHLNIFEGVPEVNDDVIQRIQQYLNKHSHNEFTVEHIQHIGSHSDLNMRIENRFAHKYILKVFNNRLFSIEGQDLFNRDDVSKFLLWIEEEKLNEHIINISCPYLKWELLNSFPRLINIITTESPNNDLNKNITPNPFPWLQSLQVSESSKGLIDYLGESIKTIEELRLATGDIKETSTHINQFINLKRLHLNHDIHHSELKLEKLVFLYSASLVSLNDLTNSPNLKYISGSIDTTSAQYQGPQIRNITFDPGSTQPVRLDNINTEFLEDISCWGDIEIQYDNFMPALRSIFEHSRKNTNEFKLTWLDSTPNLRQLNLANRKLNLDIDDNWEHSSLAYLGASSSKLDSLDFLAHFPNLESINLPNNNITNLEPISKLNKLGQANLANNSVIDIPRELAQKFNITSDLSKWGSNGNIIVSGNPLISPPIEIIERGQSAIKPYFNSMSGEVEELNEAKIVFLGNGEVGKTSLMKALSGEEFDSDEQTTHGINIKKYSVPINERYSVDASIWDFGGQQIMHATHQLFLSRRCVYVLVINDRKDDLQQDQKIEYWLQQVQTYGGDSKVIIVRNKLDMFDVNNLQEGKLKEKFPNLLKVEGVSCADGTGIDKVRNLINAQVAQLPMRKVKLASNWIQVKNEIKALSFEQDHLPLSAFTEICCKHGVHDKEAQTTLRHLLHDLSVIIAFEELADFDMGILNPHWITDGIYAIINSEILATNNGYIRLPEVQQELDSIFPEKYSGKARFIIESMMQFELCHSVGSSQSKTYLVPNLLPTEVKSKSLIYGLNTIHFIFKYENLLPPALFPKLLVRLSSNISADRRWRTGAILSDSSLNVQALIEEDSVDKVIKIIVTGDQSRDFFAHIRQSVRSLNGNNAERLGVQELIPLPNYDGHTVSYSELIGHELDDKPEYYSGKIRQSFSVAKLLSGIESREETAKAVNQFKEDMIVNVNVRTGDTTITNTNTNTNTQDQTQTATQSQRVDIKVELKGLKGSAENLLEDLRDDAQDDITDPTERKRFIRECDKVAKALDVVEEIETEDEANQHLGSFARIKDFLENSLDKTGNIGQTMELLGNNVGKVRELAKKYNKIAGFFGLPIVPEALL